MEHARALQAQGRLADAEAAFRRILKQTPEHADALHGLGIVSLQRGRPREAVDLIRAALRLESRPAMHANLALAQASAGRPADALSSFDRALELDPGFIGALVASGNLLLELRRPSAALATFERALRIDAYDADALNGAGNSLLDLGRGAEAAVHYSKAIGLRPDAPVFLLNRALAFSNTGRPSEVLEDCRRARRLGLDTAQLHFVEGIALGDLGRAAAAIESFDRALALDPSMNKARFNRCMALRQAGRRTEAWAALEDLAVVAPDSDYLQGSLLYERLSHCDWRGYDERVGALVDAVDRGALLENPFTFLAAVDSPALQLRCARSHAAKVIVRSAAEHPPPTQRPDRLRIAYLSADFHEHATAQLAAGLFEAHDRASFEVFGISFGPSDASELRSRLIRGFDHFVDVRGQPDDTVLNRLRQLEIHIAVDLKGFTEHARPSLLARRVAPVQVAYLGYPGTMGAPWIDYVIADRIVIPDEARIHYTEAVVWLPDCYQVNDSTRSRPMDRPTRAEVGLPEDGFVLCCFNANYKLTPPVFDVWMRLLHAAPSTVLWLLEDLPGNADRLRSEASARGIAPGRLIFAPRSTPLQHLARQPLADLFLDTLPVNAHTTCSDALWMGLPVLTCAGQGFASRVAASLLSACGLGELVTHSLEEYERRALEFIRAPSRLTDVRTRLQRSSRAGPLFDTARSCRHVEVAYRHMWEKHVRGASPEAFSVPDMDPDAGALTP